MSSRDQPIFLPLAVSRPYSESSPKVNLKEATDSDVEFVLFGPGVQSINAPGLQSASAIS